MNKINIFFVSLLLFLGTDILAKVTLPSLISDNMVLQQQSDVALWGTAQPGSKVIVKAGWSKDRFSAQADNQTGKWILSLPTPKAGGPYDIKISDGEPIILKNVLIGEVWFCSGQSNMEMPMRGYCGQPARGAADYLAFANPSRQIRICKIERKAATKEMDTCVGSWQTNNPNAIANVSATAYFFADALQKALGIPVGILVSSWGGSNIEAWIKRDILEKDFPEFNLEHIDKNLIGERPYQQPCLLYYGQLAPLVPYTFKGMIWYQGEANRSRYEQYIRLQSAYVKMMRELFRMPEAPFYFVQIAPYSYGNPDDFLNGYFNEAQQKTLSIIPNSGMAVTCDIGEYGTIHPASKQEVGKRLAFLALSHNYGNSALEADAPAYKSVSFKAGKAFVRFKVGPKGLSPMGTDIHGFELAGEDKVFRPAVGRLSSDCTVIEVTSPDVASPVAVRYCFRNWCKGELYNSYGIPASPFRTDNWEYTK